MEELSNVARKRFTINTFSLKPLKDKSPPLPKIKKRSPEHGVVRKAELKWVTPEEMMAMKLKMSKTQLPKIAKDLSKVPPGEALREESLIR